MLWQRAYGGCINCIDAVVKGKFDNFRRQFGLQVVLRVILSALTFVIQNEKLSVKEHATAVFCVCALTNTPPPSTIGGSANDPDLTAWSELRSSSGRWILACIMLSQC